MDRLTKTYSDGTFGVSNDMANRQNSHAFKEMLINEVGAYEDTGLTPAEVAELAQDKKDMTEPCNVFAMIAELTQAALDRMEGQK